MTTYRLQRGRAVAFGTPTTEGKSPRIVVKAGSTALRNGPSNEKRQAAKREKLLAQGILANHPQDEGLYVFQADHEFTSPTAAGDIINDGNFSGVDKWVNEDTGTNLTIDRQDKARESGIAVAPRLRFNVGELYTRNDVANALDLTEKQREGGAWMTGYSSWRGQVFIFCNVGSAGRTGHDYPNQWLDRDLIWYGNNDSHADQPRMQRMINGEIPIHVFWRGADRSSFSYAGLARARDVFGASPVGIRWRFTAPDEVAHSVASPVGIPNFHRGPPPFQGRIDGVRSDKETAIYLMVLKGNVAGLLPDLSGEEHAIKVGMSNSPRRRLAELNFGFPPGSIVKWELIDTRSFANGMSAYTAEGKVLERLRLAKKWTGGEYGVVSSEDLPTLLDD